MLFFLHFPSLPAVILVFQYRHEIQIHVSAVLFASVTHASLVFQACFDIQIVSDLVSCPIIQGDALTLHFIKSPGQHSLQSILSEAKTSEASFTYIYPGDVQGIIVCIYI